MTKLVMDDPLFISTPIYYINGDPHLGHAYTTIFGDTVARAARLEGRTVFFSTGTDEHGLKTLQNARAAGMTPEAYAQEYSSRFAQTWEELGIQPDRFLRTTQADHHAAVHRALMILWESGQIYKGEYSGWYCVPDERFFADNESEAGLCPICGRQLEFIREPDYFYRMSACQDWLVDYIQTHPDFIQPANRRNEVLGFLRIPLGDLCISRPRTRLDWGIPLPFDDQFTTYIWFDALIHYLTVLDWQNPDPSGTRMDLWPSATHLVGKDILTTHAVYWPAILHGLGLEPPARVYAHGWWVADGHKMGKSLGNFIAPLDLARKYSPEGLRYFLLRELAPGMDSEFSEERLSTRYHTELANLYGNLIQRLTTMVERYCGARVPEPAGGGMEEAILRDRFEALPEIYLQACREMRPSQALAAVMSALVEVNQYLERCAPWKEAQIGNRAAVNTALYSASEAARIASGLIQTAIPSQAAEALRRLGAPPVTRRWELDWGVLQPGSTVSSGPALFPRRTEG